MVNQRVSGRTMMPSSTSSGTQAPGPLDTENVNNAQVISPQGDLIIEYTGPSAVSHCWKVSSQLLMDKSPYFKALLDPEKFAEGRYFAQQRHISNDGPGSGVETDVDSSTDLSPSSVLPTFKIISESILELCGADAIQLFLRIMCLESLADETRVEFEDSLKSRPPAVIARLIEVADWFNSPRFIRNTLRGVGYMFGKKDRSSQGTFGPALLKMKEDRVRQNIVIAHFLQSDLLCQTMTHTLLVAGSRFWVDGLDRPATEHLRWRYLPDGIEGVFSAFPRQEIGKIANRHSKRSCTTDGSAYSTPSRIFTPISSVNTVHSKIQKRQNRSATLDHHSARPSPQLPESAASSVELD